MTTTRIPPGARRPPEPDPERPRPAAAVVAVRRIFAAETPEYFLLLGTTLFLVVFGLVMVLSSSSIESRVQDGDFFAKAARQGLYALIGIPIMLLAARAPTYFWKRWAWRAIMVAIVAQLLVVGTGLGVGNGFNTNWLQIGSFTAQPSEIVKVALIIWLALVLASKGDRLKDWRQVALPILPVAGAAIAFVLVGRDLGTAIILFAMVLGALFYAEVKLRFIGVALVAASILVLFVVQASRSRTNRIGSWLEGCTNPSQQSGDCWQTVNGWEALAHGGVFGVGLGNSTAKWSWLPESDNDFIFAIIGEELGLVGAIILLLLFIVLTIALIRIIRMQTDPFARIATSVAMVWIIGQAFVNVAVVLGILPVLGVPLPLVSAGGSALITTLAALGIVLSFARTRPDPVLQGEFRA